MERFTEPSELRHRRLMRRVLVATGVLLALLIVTLMLQSCGGERAAVETAAEPVAAAPAENASGAYAVPASLAAPVPTEPAQPSRDTSLPPEIALREPSTSVLPGQAITVTVDGTPDVTQMTLSDGVNDPQALVPDASGDGSWQVGYRVPLKPTSDRIGLSVTARNADGRWRRVWLFLTVVKPEPMIEASVSDTLGQR